MNQEIWVMAMATIEVIIMCGCHSSKIWYVQGHETLEKLQNVIPIVPRANIWMAQ